MSFQDLFNELQSDGDWRSTLQHIIGIPELGNQCVVDWYPPVDIVDTVDNLYVYVELPGVTDNSIKVDIFNNKLIISGEKLKRYTTHPSKREIRYGKFVRNITLPLSVTKEGNVDVNYDNGILKLVIDKQMESNNRFVIGVKNSSD